MVQTPSAPNFITDNRQMHPARLRAHSALAGRTGACYEIEQVMPGLMTPSDG